MMKSTSVSTLAAALALAALSLTGCTKDDVVTSSTGPVTINLDHMVGTDPLILNTNSYQNALGQDFTVSSFKYYLSNIVFNKADGNHVALPNTYFLVDAANVASRDVALPEVPVGDYTSMTLTLGVDSARIKAGNFSGALDPNNNMFWNMNGPEFKNLLLEGYSTFAPHATGATTGGLVYHIAGYQHASTNTIRTFTVPFPAGVSLLVRPDHSPEIHTLVDVAQLFRSPNQISFADRASYNVMGGVVAARIADNAASGMFTVGHIHAD
ncbi:MAG: hypothetical protein M3Y54_17970 [Bacteroidota bacterium]|nr:hypothetical protein [Bacteroidota bacterium]